MDKTRAWKRLLELLNVPSNGEDASPCVVSVEGEQVAMNMIGSAQAGHSAGGGWGGLVSDASCRGRGWGKPKDTAPIVEDLAAEKSASRKRVHDALNCVVNVVEHVEGEHVSAKIVGSERGSGWGGLVLGASCRSRGWGKPKCGEAGKSGPFQGSVMPLYLD